MRAPDSMAEPSAAAVADRRFGSGSPKAWLIGLGAVAMPSFAALIPLTMVSHQVGNGVIAAVIGVPCAAVGLVVARRQRDNSLGWLFLVIAVCLFVTADGGHYAVITYLRGHHLPFGPAGAALEEMWGPSLLLFAIAILLFPDGRLYSRFWRWALWLFGASYVVLLAATAVATAAALSGPVVRIDQSGGFSAVDHPAGWFSLVQNVLIVVLLGLSLTFVAHQALSWRRATGEGRQQLKWLASGAAVSIVCITVAGSFYSGTLDTPLGVIGGLAALGVAALPVSIGVAILKYRLYDIDRIISRTLAYALVTGLLAGVYAGLVLLATQVLRFTDSVAVAASTLAAAALFNPVRLRVQRMVDRRFNRARYDADQTVAAFAARLKDAVDLDSVCGDLTGVVTKALEPAHASVWISRHANAGSAPGGNVPRTSQA
jgi:hypothetical protein